MTSFVLASGNRGKLAELSQFFDSDERLSPLGVRLVSAADVDGAKAALDAAVESGATYEENALIKARAVADACGRPAIADDSGIEVAALDMRPGIHSARVVPGGDADRIRWLLGELGGSADRRARFCACIVVAYPTAQGLPCGARDFFSCSGTCEGTIATAPAGDGGFGYDPIFIPDGWDRTFAELPPEVKKSISHRAKALEALAHIMESVIKYSSVRESLQN